MKQLNEWINKPASFELTERGITIHAEPDSDYFNDPVSGKIRSNGHILAVEAASDFTFQCKIKPEFAETYDAGAVFFYIDDSHWIKQAFEKTDLGTTSAVSVVTDEVSDDANGETIDADSIYMKMVRKKDIFGLYYSTDAEKWRMMRLFKFITIKSGFIGVEAQSPMGQGCTISFSEIELSEKTPQNMRTAE